MWLKLTIIENYDEEKKQWVEWSPSEFIIINLADVMIFHDDYPNVQIVMRCKMPSINSEMVRVLESIDEIWTMIHATQT